MPSPDTVRVPVGGSKDHIHIQESFGKFCSDINEKISLNLSICSDLKEIVQMLYDYWFVQFDFPNENGEPYKSSGGKMIWSQELKRHIPEGWQIGKISDLGTVVGGATPSTKNKSFYVENGIGWITPNDLSNTTDKYIAHGERDITTDAVASCSTVLMPKGSVLMSSRAPIGYLAIASDTVCTNQGFKSVIPNGYSSEYIYQTLRIMMPYIKQYGGGSTFAEVSKDELSGIQVLLPNTRLEESFAQKAEEIGKKIEILERESRELIALRDFLLPMMVNGQLNV